MRSSIEKLIVSRRFQYYEPYFYTNPLALRCELGSGSLEENMKSAPGLAYRIHDILMPGGADAVIFDYWITDYAESGPAEGDEDEHAAAFNERYIELEAFSLRFLLDMMLKYRHKAVKGLKSFYDERTELGMGRTRRTRMVCWSDGRGFDDRALIDLQLNGGQLDIGLVSFENECIMSVYDDRGCDITFAEPAKFAELYEALRPYLFAYDAEEMEKRLENAKVGMKE